MIQRAPLAPRFADEPEELPGEAGEARLLDIDAAGTRIKGLRLLDVAVERGNLANLVAPELVLTRVSLTGARLTGAEWTRGRLTDVVFRDCRIDHATFAGTTFERVAVDRLRGAAMPAADIVGNAGLFAAALGIKVLDE